jgi:transposase
LKLTCEQIGSVLGVGAATVVRMNRRFRTTLGEAKSNWGGRRHQALTAEEEEEVMESLEGAAARGEVLSAKQVKVAIQERRGKPISLQTAYNCLARARWRKVVPNKVHPRQDPEKQEEFKKNSSRRRSRWLPPRLQSPVAL